LDLHDPFYGCEVEPEAPEGELREEQARVLALRAAALLGPQVARAAGKRRVNKAAPRRWLISPLHAEALHAAAELRRVAAAPSIADVEEAAEAEPAAGAADTAAPKQAKGVKRPRRAPFRWTADLLQRTLELIGASPMDYICSSTTKRRSGKRFRSFGLLSACCSALISRLCSCISWFRLSASAFAAGSSR